MCKVKSKKGLNNNFKICFIRKIVEINPFQISKSIW